MNCEVHPHLFLDALMLLAIIFFAGYILFLKERLRRSWRMYTDMETHYRWELRRARNPWDRHTHGIGVSSTGE